MKKKKEKEKIGKIDIAYLYNQPTTKPKFEFKYKQEVLVEGRVCSGIREAERKTNIPKTTIMRNCKNEIPGYKYLEKVAYTKDYSSQSQPIVHNGLVYSTISGKDGAKKALRKRSETIVKNCQDPNIKDWEFYDPKKHGGLPVYKTENLSK